MLKRNQQYNNSTNEQKRMESKISDRDEQSKRQSGERERDRES